MKHLKIALFLGLLGMVAGAFVVPYQLETLKVTLGEAEFTKIMNDIPVPLPVMFAIAAVQIGIFTTVASILGLILINRTGLSLPLLNTWLIEKKKPVIDRSGIKLAVFGGAIGAILMVFTDIFLFQPFMPKVGTGEGVSVWKALVAGVLYGGIVEEVLVRLFLMTLIVWLLAVLFKKQAETIPSYFYWTGLIIASLLFSAGHLPATSAIFDGLTPLIIARAFVLNGVLGVLFGYLYWKKGLEYAMFSHMTVHIVTQLILLPLLKLVS
jgi:membrane protease YdiL (CAAX protease family)